MAEAEVRIHTGATRHSRELYHTIVSYAEAAKKHQEELSAPADIVTDSSPMTASLVLA